MSGGATPATLATAASQPPGSQLRSSLRWRPQQNKKRVRESRAHLPWAPQNQLAAPRRWALR
eukprot:8205022-Lingulodinium_polyedra.AAC.1